MSVLTSLVLFCISVCSVAAVKVCPSICEYEQNSTGRCFDSPISDKNITEIIRNWGFTAEEHYIGTDDGYILLLERAHAASSTKGTPIIIVHGIAMNGLGFVYRDKDSLVYFLGSLGYDVWILNFRGTEYSRGHTNLNNRDTRYWYYSIHELGVHDLRTTIKYVNEVTKQQAIYIGYSTGTTSFYAYSSTLPDEAKRYLKGMIGLGPAINFKGVKSLLQVSSLVWPILRPVIYALWNGEIVPGYKNLMKPLMETPWGLYLAQTLVNLVGGPDYKQMDPISLPHLPKWFDTAAIEVWTHFIQIYQSGVFQNYDHGVEKNFMVYGQAVPPAYNISKISVPVALFVGANDWLAPVQNAEQLYTELADSSRCGYCFIANPGWSHYDFIMAKDIKKYLYEPLFEKIVEMENEKCKP